MVFEDNEGVAESLDVVSSLYIGDEGELFDDISGATGGDGFVMLRSVVRRCCGG